jgi:hypothetical protein
MKYTSSWIKSKHFFIAWLHAAKILKVVPRCQAIMLISGWVETAAGNIFGFVVVDPNPKILPIFPNPDNVFPSLIAILVCASGDPVS